MRHAICKLTFTTATRFGSDAGGSSLTGTAMTFRADVLFSALFAALVRQGSADELLRSVNCGELALSDALPWRGDRLFLPKPVGIFARPDSPAFEDPSQRKLLKKITFIPSDALMDFMAGRANLTELRELNSFGKPFEVTRVNRRDGDQPLPYRVGGFRFADNCGLYIVVSGTDAALELFDRGMLCLSADGIGGKISSGWGKFAFETRPAPENWNRALDDVAAPRQMLLSTALPADDELEAALDGAYYTVARRGGFTNSEQIAPLKKRTVHLLGAGSTFRRRFAGTVLDVGVGMPHPVWRYARGMFMGVNA